MPNAFCSSKSTSKENTLKDITSLLSEKLASLGQGPNQILQLSFPHTIYLLQAWHTQLTANVTWTTRTISYYLSSRVGNYMHFAFSLTFSLYVLSLCVWLLEFQSSSTLGSDKQLLPLWHGGLLLCWMFIFCALVLPLRYLGRQNIITVIFPCKLPCFHSVSVWV